MRPVRWAALSAVSSMRNSSRGACRKRRRRPISPRRKPPARVSPSRTCSAGFFEANGVKNTRATPISAARLTAVMVTFPTRGSFTSRATSSESTRWISDSIRRVRASATSLASFESSASFQRSRELASGAALDLVAGANILIVPHADTALHTRPNLTHVVLKAAQRLERALEDHNVFAQNTNGVIALHNAFRNQASGDNAELAGAEYVAHLRHTQDRLLNLRLQHARQHRLHVVDGFVNDAVVTNLDAGLLDRLTGARISPDVEADDETLRCRGELHVGFGDATQAARDRLHLHFVSGKAQQRFAQCFGAALHV